ncbi:hypothetical protein [Hydrogenovibrio marinus]|uniref:Lipoprotein n=1 Tax=Hydrogenovibrio marinus TaxID=28885 RepID=A0A066ZRL7_HYDMR|nr:hypothetical protein [Hydrogenovibrio marinus]KDN96132.1 hypothetical protein EI16_07535 [Hydrogenovibrio marinus]BBN60691.1 hypothetical protein HVMH_2285 [Hydrogenovibrio marinus]
MIVSKSTPFKLVSLAAILGLGLTACSLTPPKSVMDVQAEDSFQLNQTLTVPANATRVFIQFGKVTTRSSFSRLDQHCELEVNQVEDHEQRIFPDQFIVSKVRIGSEMVAQNQKTVGKVFFAEANNGVLSDVQLNPMQLTIASDDNNRVETMDTVMIYLKPTDKNPGILRLTCAGSLSNGSLQDAPRSYRPEKAQINAILGTIGHLN